MLHFLLWIFDEKNQMLVKVVLSIEDVNMYHDLDDKLTYFMEKDSQEAIKSLLPSHIRDLGPIVNLEEIDAVVKA